MSMIYIMRDTYMEVRPESEEDIALLLRAYPTLWPFQHVCVSVADMRDNIASCRPSSS